YRRMGLLKRRRQNIDVAIVEIVTFIAERPGSCTKRLEDQIMSLVEALHALGSIRVRNEDFERRALDQADLQPSAREGIDVCNLFSDAQRIKAIEQRNSKREQTRLLRVRGENSERQHARDGHAQMTGVMFVDHDVKANFIGNFPFLD